jgi:hypothetical protein
LYPPGTNIATKANVTYQWNPQSLFLAWRTDIGTSGSTILPKGNAAQPSVYTPLPIKTWHEFRKYVTQLDDRRYIFRGQNKPLRLRTPFHRTGRGDMHRYLVEDIPVLHRHLSARTRHFFNLTNPLENAAFLHLIQHHGYPTPLLDWTYSPYIAAYFAYHRIKSSEAAIASEDQKVRIFVFDKLQWCVTFPQIANLSARWEHFSILEPLAIENERLVPQQALSTFTTVDDIESYIDLRQKEQNAQYLEVIDLPMSERDDVVRELRLMGITAGSLFPGLDGACEELKDRFFRL